MSSTELLQYGSVFLLSIVKLVLGSVPLSLVYIKSFGLSFVLCMTLCCIGGYLGVFIFTNMGKRLWVWWDNLPFNRSREKKPKTMASKRRTIYIKNKYGLWGISFLSPVLLSIPGGCIMASRFYKDKSAIYLRMCIAITVWVWGSGLLLWLVF
ncbi:MAG: hypothetical protein EXR21_07660 [Flavobacteriaceae bacterium]|nr:hypothetical protein [Flavobacteriaceae bacterium]